MNFLEFIEQFGGKIIYFILLAIIAIIQIVKYGKVNKQTEILLKECDNVKYKLESSEKTCKGQIFNSVVPEYELDEKTNTLVTIGTKDLQELIQSSADCALKKILDKFGCYPEGFIPQQPVVSEESDKVNVVQIKEDLDYYNDILDFQEELRERYKFDDGMSLSDMMTALDGMKKSVDGQIQSELQKQSKGGKNDEKEKND